jgi:hypothetical protein
MWRRVVLWQRRHQNRKVTIDIFKAVINSNLRKKITLFHSSRISLLDIPHIYLIHLHADKGLHSVSKQISFLKGSACCALEGRNRRPQQVRLYLSKWNNQSSSTTHILFTEVCDYDFLPRNNLNTSTGFMNCSFGSKYSVFLPCKEFSFRDALCGNVVVKHITQKWPAVHTTATGKPMFLDRKNPFVHCCVTETHWLFFPISLTSACSSLSSPASQSRHSELLILDACNLSTLHSTYVGGPLPECDNWSRVTKHRKSVKPEFKAIYSVVKYRRLAAHGS